MILTFFDKKIKNVRNYLNSNFLNKKKESDVNMPDLKKFSIKREKFVLIYNMTDFNIFQ